ncbi:hypothetical protein FRB99_002947 [Tulasnella sp. 403]|nr:hypothetical protein FRB99_002947 [Tulasnella sp. 403]
MTDDEDAKVAYEKAKNDLVAALNKKRVIDKSLAALEANLYNFEGSYLQDTATSGGNIIQGFDGYLKNNTSNRRKAELNLDNDRLFSNSSTTHLKALEMNQEEPIAPPTPNLTTVALTAPSPVAVPPAISDLRRDSRLGRGQRRRTEDPEFIPSSVTTPGPRPGRPAKRQKLMNDD